MAGILTVALTTILALAFPSAALANVSLTQIQ